MIQHLLPFLCVVVPAAATTRRDRCRINKVPGNAQLFNKESPYERQKSQLVNQLCQRLASLPMPKDLLPASLRDLVRFMVWKDKSGKNQVHAVGCSRQRLTCPSQRDCPHRLAAGSFDSLIGKLFKENTRAGDWEEKLGLGNPASSLLVRKYLKCIKEELANAGLTPKQAKIIDRQFEAYKTDPINMYIIGSSLFQNLIFIWGQTWRHWPGSHK